MPWNHFKFVISLPCPAFLSSVIFTKPILYPYRYVKESTALATEQLPRNKSRCFERVFVAQNHKVFTRSQVLSKNFRHSRQTDTPQTILTDDLVSMLQNLLSLRRRWWFNINLRFCRWHFFRLVYHIRARSNTTRLGNLTVDYSVGRL